MPTRNVVVTSRQAEMIERLVAQGRYQNASEVLREGLRLIEARDVVEEQKLAALRDAAKVGWDDIEAGRYRTLRTEAELHGYVAELIRSGLADPTE